jgi:hypothetical protein
MDIQNISLLHNEITSIGININGCSSDGTVQIASRPTCPEGEEETWVDPTDTLVALVLAAHEQPLSSDECLALQAELSEDAWLAYTECRKAPIKQARAALYKDSTDPLLLSALETALKTATATNGEITVVLSETATQEWLTAKDTVRTNNPYPE